jgi:hypothetical protein
VREHFSDYTRETEKRFNAEGTEIAEKKEERKAKSTGRNACATKTSEESGEVELAGG